MSCAWLYMCMIIHVHAFTCVCMYIENWCSIVVVWHLFHVLFAAVWGYHLYFCRVTQTKQLDYPEYNCSVKKILFCFISIKCILIIKVVNLYFRKIIQIIHDNGGQVYLDGANMNAQVIIYIGKEMGMQHWTFNKIFRKWTVLLYFITTRSCNIHASSNTHTNKPSHMRKYTI